MSSTEGDPVLAAIAQDWADWVEDQKVSKGANPKWDRTRTALSTLLGCAVDDLGIKSAKGENFAVRLNELKGKSVTPRYGVMICGPTVKKSSEVLTTKPRLLVRTTAVDAVLTICSEGKGESPEFQPLRLAVREHSKVIEVLQATWPDLITDKIQETGTIRSSLAEAASLQEKYSPDPNNIDMKARTEALDVASELLAERILSFDPGYTLKVENRCAIGNPSRAPYLRVFNPDDSPNASVGYYVCVFIKGDGQAVYVSLQHPATRGHAAGFEQKSAEILAAHSQLWFEKLSADVVFGPVMAKYDARRQLDISDQNGHVSRKQRNYVHSDIASTVLQAAALPTDEEIVEAIQEFCKVARFLNAESVAPLSTSAVVAQVAEAIHWSEQRVAELLESLSDSSPQIVLAGPPGTGKTYVSRWVASALLGAPGVLDDPRITLVQFHPTYGYEDFVEGLRPVSKDGAVVFETTPGPIVRLAKEIKDNDEPRVLIIDEINRANIPRVFGELMYLLEYRDQSMDLMLEPNFVLPSQLHIIATMNTADKSTRVMDVALRRRFDFFQLDPDVDVLKAHYADGHQNELGDELFDGFISLNNRLMEDLDRHRLIGHSYFMTDHMDAHVLRARWNRQICPLLEEYFYERQVKDERYQMGEFWPSAAGA